MSALARCSLIAALALSLSAVADDSKPQPQRAILERHDQSDVPGKEIVIGTATLPAGTSIGFHVHPGDEAGYVLKGTIIWRTRGSPTGHSRLAIASSIRAAPCTALRPRTQARGW